MLKFRNGINQKVIFDITLKKPLISFSSLLLIVIFFEWIFLLHMVNCNKESCLNFSAAHSLARASWY